MKNTSVLIHEQFQPNARWRHQWLEACLCLKVCENLITTFPLLLYIHCYPIHGEILKTTSRPRAANFATCINISTSSPKRKPLNAWPQNRGQKGQVFLNNVISKAGFGPHQIGPISHMGSAWRDLPSLDPPNPLLCHLQPHLQLQASLLFSSPSSSSCWIHPVVGNAIGFFVLIGHPLGRSRSQNVAAARRKHPFSLRSK